MAYKSRFSFWEHKGSLALLFCSDVDSSQPQPVTRPALDTGSGPQPTTSSAEELSSNGAMGGPDTPGGGQSPGSKKVVKIVRRVVRRVVPGGMEEQNQPTISESARAASTANPVPKNTKAGGQVEKDDISMGLTSLMGRGRTKEHRPRTRTQDRKEDLYQKEEGKQQEEEKGKAEEEEEKPAEEKTEEAASTSVSTTAPPNPLPPKSNPLAPPAGFIPAPKSDPLAPPAGFIPGPKQNPLTPPAGFIPASKSNPMPPKQNPLVRPAGFIPVPKTDPLAPPAGFIPKPRSIAVKKSEA
ncbi:thioredoxin domain-containing protein 2-like [Centroberyx affinis]|uniref:thioredoxin domain-containing protein 2-like n=1 Tax=Centroberyx affinis TaxID=166261 RepID=UPI003A5C0729